MVGVCHRKAVMAKEYSEVEKEIIQKAKKKALSILGFSDKTEKMLREKLIENEFPDYAVEASVEYVRSFHYIDDSRYAGNYILAKSAEKSIFEIRHILKERGVSEAEIEKALSEADISEEDTVKALFLKKYGYKDLSDPKIFEKALRYFAGKGFAFEAVKNGIKRGIEESENA